MGDKGTLRMDRYTRRKALEIELMNACLEQGDGLDQNFRHITSTQEREWDEMCEQVTGNKQQRNIEQQRERNRLARRPEDAI